MHHLTFLLALLSCSLLTTASACQIDVLVVKNPSFFNKKHVGIQFTINNSTTTYGHYSTYRDPVSLFTLGWIPHRGRIMSPDPFIEGLPKKNIPPGKIVNMISILDNEEKCLEFKEMVDKEKESPPSYSLLFSNCANWIDHVLSQYVSCSSYGFNHPHFCEAKL